MPDCEICGKPSAIGTVCLACKTLKARGYCLDFDEVSGSRKFKAMDTAHFYEGYRACNRELLKAQMDSFVSPAASEGGTGTTPEKCPDCDSPSRGANFCLVPDHPHPYVDHDWCRNKFHRTPVASVEGQRTGEQVECPECHAKSDVEAQQKCAPGEDNCPMTCWEHWPLQAEFDAREAEQIKLADKQIAESSVPDVEGMGAREQTAEDFYESHPELEALYWPDPDRWWNREVFAFAEAFHKQARSLRGAGERELERAREARKHTQDWYARHYGKIEDWARKILPEPWRTQFFNCVANGIYDHTKDVGEPYMSVGVGMITPSGYFRMESAAEQLMRDQTERAEASESRGQAMRECLRDFTNGTYDKDLLCQKGIVDRCRCMRCIRERASAFLAIRTTS